MKRLAFVLLLLLPQAAFAEDLLMRLDLTAEHAIGSQANKRSVVSTVRVADGDTAVLDMKPEEKTGNTRETWRFRPKLAGGERVRVESQLEVQVDDSPPQHSKFAATLLEGEPWEASVDTAGSRLVYRLTVWRVPAGSKFAHYDGKGNPVWSKT